MSDERMNDKDTAKAGATGSERRSLIDDLGKRITETAKKGVDALKEGADRVEHFAQETTHLARVKLDLRNLNDQLNRLHRQTGLKLWELNEAGKLTKTDARAFKSELDRMSVLSESIAEKEKEIDDISLTL